MSDIMRQHGNCEFAENNQNHKSKVKMREQRDTKANDERQAIQDDRKIAQQNNSGSSTIRKDNEENLN